MPPRGVTYGVRNPEIILLEVITDFSQHDIIGLLGFQSTPVRV